MKKVINWPPGSGSVVQDYEFAYPDRRNNYVLLNLQNVWVWAHRDGNRICYLTGGTVIAEKSDSLQIKHFLRVLFYSKRRFRNIRYSITRKNIQYAQITKIRENVEGGSESAVFLSFYGSVAVEFRGVAYKYF